MAITRLCIKRPFCNTLERISGITMSRAEPKNTYTVELKKYCGVAVPALDWIFRIIFTKRVKIDSIAFLCQSNFLEEFDFLYFFCGILTMVVLSGRLRHITFLFKPEKPIARNLLLVYLHSNVLLFTSVVIFGYRPSGDNIARVFFYSVAAGALAVINYVFTDPSVSSPLAFNLEIWTERNLSIIH